MASVVNCVLCLGVVRQWQSGRARRRTSRRSRNSVLIRMRSLKCLGHSVAGQPKYRISVFTYTFPRASSAPSGDLALTKWKPGRTITETFPTRFGQNRKRPRYTRSDSSRVRSFPRLSWRGRPGPNRGPGPSASGSQTCSRLVPRPADPAADTLTATTSGPG
jgi:hypothetical protein